MSTKWDQQRQENDPPYEQPPPYYNNASSFNQGSQQYQHQPQSPIMIQPTGHFGQQQMIELGQMPMSMAGPGYATNATLELLRTHDRLLICSPGRVDETMCHINVQDQSGRNVFTVQVQGTSRLVAANANAAQFAYGAIYSIHDSSGLEVIKGIQETSSMHVSMQNRAVGSVQNNNVCSTSFTATSLTEGSNFQIEGDQSCGLACFPCCTESDFKILGAQDVGSMTAGKMITGKSLCVNFPPSTNPNSKALLMAGAIMIFIGYFGKTRCGSSGVRGASCCGGCCCCCG